MTTPPGANFPSLLNPFPFSGYYADILILLFVLAQIFV
ncbi:hypothetical protein TOT_020000161 [Theileria orientalis strain Shintoku]|uniref:Uncharacterized protein n=1 Tax=Theileria orientalis strain Shintoku TaxID=869250 RepID=J4DP09_THEOR|nr:hypothetical protein TOT_020000161 [Theileria orientalis strain Shintoku]BAM39889.1 hypothetical protein TOT_020000161 [Theileria orientalis strain Shintoku]|eukprot:XP_009690190.1 hypothetical protein TOT_020000161 [Theileria orientalis strain Shintoku]